MTATEPRTTVDCQIAARQCATVDGLRALLEFVERHPETLGDYGTYCLIATHTDPATFLQLEQTLAGVRDDTSETYVMAVRDFGGGIRLAAQTYRADLVATPARIAEFIDGAL